MTEREVRGGFQIGTFSLRNKNALFTRTFLIDKTRGKQEHSGCEKGLFLNNMFFSVFLVMSKAFYKDHQGSILAPLTTMTKLTLTAVGSRFHPRFSYGTAITCCMDSDIIGGHYSQTLFINYLPWITQVANSLKQMWLKRDGAKRDKPRIYQTIRKCLGF